MSRRAQQRKLENSGVGSGEEHAKTEAAEIRDYAEAIILMYLRGRPAVKISELEELYIVPDKNEAELATRLLRLVERGWIKRKDTTEVPNGYSVFWLSERGRGIADFLASEELRTDYRFVRIMVARILYQRLLAQGITISREELEKILMDKSYQLEELLAAEES